MSEQEKVLAMPEGIDFNAPLLDINDQPVKGQDGQTIITLGEVCCNALLANFQGDNADGTAKLKRFNLARKIKGSSEEEDFPVLRLNSSQKKMIEELVAKVYPTLTYGRVYEALEGKAEEE